MAAPELICTLQAAASKLTCTPQATAAAFVCTRQVPAVGLTCIPQAAASVLTEAGPAVGGLVVSIMLPEGMRGGIAPRGKAQNATATCATRAEDRDTCPEVLRTLKSRLLATTRYRRRLTPERK